MSKIIVIVCILFVPCSGLPTSQIPKELCPIEITSTSSVQIHWFLKNSVDNEQQNTHMYYHEPNNGVKHFVLEEQAANNTVYLKDGTNIIKKFVHVSTKEIKIRINSSDPLCVESLAYVDGSWKMPCDVYCPTCSTCNKPKKDTTDTHTSNTVKFEPLGFLPLSLLLIIRSTLI